MEGCLKWCGCFCLKLHEMQFWKEEVVQLRLFMDQTFPNHSLF